MQRLLSNCSGFRCLAQCWHADADQSLTVVRTLARGGTSSEALVHHRTAKRSGETTKTRKVLTRCHSSCRSSSFDARPEHFDIPAGDSQPDDVLLHQIDRNSKKDQILHQERYETCHRRKTGSRIPFI